MEDSGEVLDDSSSSPSSTLKNYPLTCKVLYSYKVRGQEQSCSGGDNRDCESGARSHKRGTLGTPHRLNWANWIQTWVQMWVFRCEEWRLSSAELACLLQLTIVLFSHLR